MKNALLLISFFLLVTACTKDYTDSSCLNKEISNFEKGNYACDSTANVKEYQFQNKMVYVFDPGYCGADMTSEVIDANCNSLGHLGGFAGNGIINGVNFYDSSVYVRTIWSN